MKVSILMTVYNQEGLISQAIESVLMQEVDFDYEIVIGEDNSIDRTREIVLRFQAKYPRRSACNCATGNFRTRSRAVV
jgi:glycosyltransferase involved in cell wall biosynthesis